MLGGRPLFEWEAGIKAGSALYMDGELPLWLLRDRAASVFRPTDNVSLFNAASWYEKGGKGLDLQNCLIQEQLLQLIRRLRPSILVLDNRSNFYHGKENENDDAHSLNRFLIQLRQMGLTIIVNHHQGKGGGFRGASAIVDVMDNVICLDKADHPTMPSFHVKFEKARFGWPPSGFDVSIRVDQTSGLTYLNTY
jgi:hypothetical protein